MENIMTDGIITDGKLILNGKRYKLVLDEEQQVQDKHRTGWERANYGEKYYIVDTQLNSDWNYDEFSDYSDRIYDSGNYTNDEKLSDNISRAVSLYFRMLRWQAENDEPVDIHNPDMIKWHVSYNVLESGVDVNWAYNILDSFTVYFSTKEKAEECIEIFREDLMWLHTQFYHRLDARGVCNEKV